jgi:hypothetical protein
MSRSPFLPRTGVALRTMPDLDDFAKLATSLPGNGGKMKAPGAGCGRSDPAEEMPRYAREPVEFRHWARLVLSRAVLLLDARWPAPRRSR